MQKGILIIIPVLNEVNNIIPIINRIRKHLINKHHILFIDDNSKDGTLNMIQKMKKKYKNIFFIQRPNKLGIGSAHKKGISWAYHKKYKTIVTMDCDGTHDPIYIKKMIYILNKKNFDLISTNRFLKADSLKDWSEWRKRLTILRHLLIKFLLNIEYDSSGAFRCYDTRKIKLQDILQAENNSYSFFWESMFLLSKKNYKIFEIPIKLPGRLSGSSKMRLIDILSALIHLIKIYFKNISSLKN